MSTDAHPFPLFPKAFSGLPLLDVTTAEDLRRAAAHEHLAVTLAPDVAMSAGVHARNEAAENVLLEVHVDETLPAGSWHAGPPRPRTASPMHERFAAAARAGREAVRPRPQHPGALVVGPAQAANLERALGLFDDPPFVYEFTDANGPMRCHPASGVGPLTLHAKRAHVATLPDGTRVNIPAGTVLREGEIERRSLPPINLNDALVRLAHGECDSAEKAALMHFIRCWHQPSREVIARDLLQRARVLLVETGGADVLAEVDAFLAGAPPK